MEKGYLAFVEELRREFIRTAGVDEDSVRFKRKEEEPQTDEDRMYLFLREENGKRFGCGIYTEELYASGKNQNNLHGIVKEVLMRMERVQKLRYLNHPEMIADYERVRSSLFIRLLNYPRNKEELENVVFERIGDIALVLYQKLGEQENTIISVKIRRTMLDLWQLDKRTVMEQAMQNTCEMTPPRFYLWERLMEDPDYEGESFLDSSDIYELHRGWHGNCLSTTVKTNGAVAAFFPGVAKKIAELFDTGFYLVFTSIHEVMIHSDEFAEPETLRGILKDTIRKATPPGEILSYKIYHYDKKTGVFTWE